MLGELNVTIHSPSWNSFLKDHSFPYSQILSTWAVMKTQTHLGTLLVTRMSRCEPQKIDHSMHNGSQN